MVMRQTTTDAATPSRLRTLSDWRRREVLVATLNGVAIDVLVAQAVQRARRAVQDAARRNLRPRLSTDGFDVSAEEQR